MLGLLLNPRKRLRAAAAFAATVLWGFGSAFASPPGFYPDTIEGDFWTWGAGGPGNPQRRVFTWSNADAGWVCYDGYHWKLTVNGSGAVTGTFEDGTMSGDWSRSVVGQLVSGYGYQFNPVRISIDPVVSFDRLYPLWLYGMAAGFSCRLVIELYKNFLGALKPLEKM